MLPNTNRSNRKAVDRNSLWLPNSRRNFLGLFKRRGAATNIIRPGAMSAAVLKHRIDAIGVGGIAEIMRIGFDGEIDDMPITLQITSISKEEFSGRVISVERQIIEGNTARKIYAKHGGGIIDFRFDDGDVKEVKESVDYQELSELRDVGNLVEVLSALDVRDRILVAYFDKKHHGTVNFEGVLLSQLRENRQFDMMIDKINGVSLDKQINKQFDIQRELVIDIAIV